MSSTLAEVHQAARRLSKPSDDVPAMYRRVVRYTLRELQPALSRAQAPDYTDSCGLATFKGEVPRVSRLFAAFRAALDVRTFLFLRNALERGTAAICLHAGRSHLQNVLSLFEAHAGLRCAIEKHSGRGACTVAL